MQQRRVVTASKDLHNYPMQCNYINTQGIRCHFRCHGTNNCNKHLNTNVSIISQPKDCPICLENVSKMIWFRCTHGVCSTCLVRLQKLECPICRANIASVLSSNQRSSIERNMRIAKIEKEE